MVVGTSGFWVTTSPLFICMSVCARVLTRTRVCTCLCVGGLAAHLGSLPPITPVTHPLYPLSCSLSVKPRNSFPGVGVASQLAPGVSCFSYLSLEFQASCPTCSVGIQTPVFFVIRQALSPQATPEPLGAFCLVVEK